MDEPVGTDKKLKLANTKKRFKELQELKKKRNETGASNNVTNDSAQSSNRTTPVQLQDSAASEVIVEKCVEFALDTPEVNSAPDNSLTDYFSQPNAENPVAFFDSLAEKVPDTSGPALLTYFNTSEQAKTDSDNIGLPRYFDNNTENQSELIWENTVANGQTDKGTYQLFAGKKDSEVKILPEDPDVSSVDYPEIKQLQIGDYARKNSLNLRNLQVSHYFPTDRAAATPMDNQNFMAFFESTGATEEEKTDICHINEIDESTNIAKKEAQYSNVESLKQLSDHLSQMMEPDCELNTRGSMTDLEKRNAELAAMLEAEQLKSAQLEASNEQLSLRTAHLERELRERDAHKDPLQDIEISQLKRDLQAHLQTIGLLVAEKTELSSNLAQYELACKQKTAESEELQARLRASRSRVADLEQELGSLKGEKSKYVGVEEQYSIALDKLKQDYRELSQQKEALTQDLMEVREKLKNLTETNIKLQEENKDTNGKLLLAEVKIQQLSSAGDVTTDTRLERLAQEKFSLESEVNNLNQMLKSIIKERDESTVQFQQYAQQLNDQITNLSSKIDHFQRENERLIIQEQNRIKHISDLEKQLQTIQDGQVAFATRNTNSEESRSEVEKTRELLVQLQIEKTALEENFTKLTNENHLILKEVEAKNSSIAQLQSLLERLQGNQPDSVKLLATMESDKVAASRAIQQNRELKEQLDALQEAILKSNADIEVLTENLDLQLRTNQSLVEQMAKNEESLKSMAAAIDIKDKESTHLKVLNEQLEDRLRHYEAHGNSAPTLQHELQEARRTIVRMSEELNRGQKTVETEEKSAQIDISSSSPSPDTSVESTNSHSQLNHKEIDSVVVHQLEEKVKKTMQEIADLSDEKQRLEHLVMQLQSETETIGEYVALYQHQRLMLKQKTIEKDQQLKQLARDKEDMKIKLEKLNDLVRKMVPRKISGVNDNNQLQEHEPLANNSVVSDGGGRTMDETKSAFVGEEIIELLQEIKASNLVRQNEDVHHCPWCSGQLMTV